MRNFMGKFNNLLVNASMIDKAFFVATVAIFAMVSACGDVATIADQAKTTSANYVPASLVVGTLNAATVDIDYKEIIKVNGGIAPFKFALSKGVLPRGLTLEATTGIISGIVPNSEAKKENAFSISVLDGNGVKDDQSFTIKINPYTYDLSPDVFPSVVPHQPYSVTIKPIGGFPPYTFTVGGSLPIGMNFDQKKGIITADPEAVIALKGDTSVPLNMKVVDVNGIEVSKDYKLKIVDIGYKAVAFSDKELSPLVPDAEYKEFLPINGGSAPFVFRISKGELPKGIKFDTATGALTGKITADLVKNKEFLIYVDVTDVYNQTDSHSYALKIAPYTFAIVPSDLPLIIPSVEFSMKLAALGAAAPVTYASSGDLPSKLKLSPDGVLATVSPHVSAADAKSTWPIEVTATDANGIIVKKSLTINIGTSPSNSSPLGINNTTLSTMLAGASYSSGIMATGGVAPLSFTIMGGNLPTGLTLDPKTGSISGSLPLASAGSSYAAIIKVADSIGQTVTQSFSGSVSAGSSGLVIASTTISTPIAGSTYSSVVAVSGGQTPYVFAVQSGSLPTGLILSTTTGAISGTVSNAAGGSNYLFAVSVTDATNVTVSKTFAGTVASSTSPLTIQTTTLATITAGASYSAGVSVTGGVAPITFAVSSGSLPTGVSLSTSTGIISGTIPYASAGAAYAFVVTATDAVSQTNSKTYTGTVAASSSVLTMASTTISTPIAGSTYSSVIAVSGGQSPYTFAVATGTLPTGLNLNTTTGAITGTVNNSIGGNNYLFSISVTDAAAATVSRNFSGTIASSTSPLSIQTTTLATLTAGASYSSGISVTGGVAPISFSVTSGALPTGVSLSSASGVISGTIPYASAGAAYAFVITATDLAGQTSAKTYTGNVGASSSVLTIASTTISTPIAGSSYSSVIAVSGGQSPYLFSVTSGTLPSGLSLDGTTGAISGNVSNTVGGNGYLFAITVTDSASQTTSKTYSGSISNSSSPLAMQTTALAAIVAGSPYSMGVSVTGGVAPIAFSISSGTLPTGLALASSTGIISGTLAYAAAGSSYLFGVTATDAASQTVSRTFSGTVTSGATALVITTNTITAPDAGASYAAVVSLTGGVTPYAFTVSSGTLPSGLSLSSTTGAITGTPSYATAGTAFVFTVTVTDAINQTASKAYSGTIGSASAALAIQTATITTPTAGASYLASIVASGGVAPYTFSVSSGSLPSGLAIGASSGLISGTVAYSVRNNPYLFSITVADSASHSTVQSYSGFIGDYALSLAPASLTPATPGVNFSNTIITVGGQSPYTYALTSGTLPSGLSLDTSTGEISGTVADAEAGLTKTLTIRTTDTNGATVSRTFSLATSTFAISLTTGSLSGAVEGSAYTNSSTSLAASGGTSPYTYQYTGSLPTGVGLTSTGTFFGTPASGSGALSSGTNYPITIYVRDAANRVSQAYARTLNVTVSSPVVASGTPTAGVLGTPYSYSFSATGGRAGYTYSLASGSLPTGLTLSSGGTVSGTPSGAVACPAGNFTITATDVLSQVSTAATKCITTLNAVSITSTSFPLIVTGVLYSATLTATGGTPPYTYTATGLPSGITLNSSTGAFTGYDNDPVGDYAVYLTASDSSAQTLSNTRSFTLKVRNPLSITTNSVSRGGSGITYGPVTINATGGQTPYSFSITSGSLPSGLTLSSAGVISGTAANNSAAGSGTYNFSITATDALAQTSTAQAYTMYITRAPKIVRSRFPTAVVGVPYAHDVERVGGVNPFISTANLASQFTWSATGLPSGLSINSSSGRISGTPSAGTASGSPYTVAMSLSDAWGITGTNNVTLEVRTAGLTFDMASPRTVEPCPTGGLSNCDPLASAVGVLVPAQSTTKYVVYGALLTGTAALPTSTKIYIGRVDSAGRIPTPGTSVYSLAYTPTTTGYITGVDIADIDNDGYPDIIFADNTNNKIVVVWNSGTVDGNGMPVFSSENSFSMPASGAKPFQVKAVQLRPDATNLNKKDLIVSDYDILTPATVSRIVVFLAQNACSTNCSGTRSAAYTGTGASITAYNTTLVVPAVGLTYVGGIGTGYFNTAPGAGVCPSIVITGRRASGSSDDYIFMRRQTYASSVCDGSFTLHVASDEKMVTTANTNGLPSAPAIADFNNDGISDIAVVLKWTAIASSAAVKVFMMPGGNTFPASPLTPLLPSTTNTNYVAGGVIPYCTNGATSCTYPGLLVAGGRDRPTWITAGTATAYGFLSIIPNQGSSPWFEDMTGNNRIDYEAPPGIGSNGIIATPLITSGKNDILLMGTENNANPYYFMVPRNGSSTTDPFNIKRMLRSLPAFANGATGEVGTIKLSDVTMDGTFDVVSHLVNSSAIGIITGDLTANTMATIPDPVFNPIGSNFGLTNTWHYQKTMDTSDFNEDGYPDFVTVGNLSEVVTVNFGDGTTTVGSSIMLNPGVSGVLYPRVVVADDFDNDGHADIIIQSYNTTSNNYSMAFFKGHGNGTFDQAVEFATANAICADTRTMLSKDLNGDGRPELALLCYGAQALWIVRRHTDAGGTWVKNSGLTINSSVGQINGTALAIDHLTSTTGYDVVVGGLDVTNSYRIINGLTLGTPDAAGNFTVTATQINPYQSIRGYLSTAEIADLDNDGYGDIVLAPASQAGTAPGGINANYIYTCLTTSVGNCTKYGWSGDGVGPTSVSIGDVNNDGKVDIFWGNRAGSRLYQRMIGRGINTSY